MTQIAFLGLGNMGGPMAANLAAAGHRVAGFDLVPFLCEAAAAQGVSIAASAKAAVEGAEVVISMLPAGAQVVALYQQVLPAAAQGTLFIDCSTIDVESARTAHALAGAAWMASVDAPVSGGTAGARAATLTFMCGGTASGLEAARPLLEKMGRKIIACGAGGAGQAAKICNNMILGASMIATAEAFVLGEKLGLSHQALFDVASTSSGQSWSLTAYCPVPGPVPASPANTGYKPGFAAALMLKDLKLSQDAAAAHGAATPMGALAAELYARFNAAGNAGVDFSGIVEMLRGTAREG